MSLWSHHIAVEGLASDPDGILPHLTYACPECAGRYPYAHRRPHCVYGHGPMAVTHQDWSRTYFDCAHCGDTAIDRHTHTPF